MNTKLATALKQKQPIYFISPHFDDAILSAGSLMTLLSSKTPLTVVNIFTKGGNRPYSLSAKKYLQQCGYTDATQLYNDREKEDKLVLQQVTKKIVNLGFPDALWRKKQTTRLGKILPDFDLVYPTYRFHVIKGNIASQDLQTISEIETQLQKIITEENALVFCPVGVGSHIDHVITRKVCEDLFSDIIYWSDFPYNNHSDKIMENCKQFVYDEHVNEKRKLIEGYKTQYDAMFKSGLNLPPEKFYYR